MKEKGKERGEDGASCCCDTDGVEDEGGICSDVQGVKAILYCIWPSDILKGDVVFANLQFFRDFVCNVEMVYQVYD